jgi:hypothetical protein
MNAPASDTTLALGTVLRALTDADRRDLCLALAERPAQDGGWDPQALIDGHVTADDLEVKLQHLHLPLLASEGFIEWNREHGTVSTGPNWADPEAGLTALADNHEELPGPPR